MVILGLIDVVNVFRIGWKSDVFSIGCKGVVVYLRKE